MRKLEQCIEYKVKKKITLLKGHYTKLINCYVEYFRNTDIRMKLLSHTQQREKESGTIRCILKCRLDSVCARARVNKTA